MMMQKKIISPELQPIRALSCLLSTILSLAGSRGVLILLHLELAESRLRTMGSVIKYLVSLELGISPLKSSSPLDLRPARLNCSDSCSSLIASEKR